MGQLMINVLFSREQAKLKSAFAVLPDDRFKVIACPTIDIVAVEKNRQLADEFIEINTADYLIFTSQYAVSETVVYLKQLGIGIEQLKAIKICVVGPMVACQLAEYGLIADMMPRLYTAESLGDLFAPINRNKRLKIFFPKGDRAANKLAQVLANKGYEVVSPIIYKTTLRSELDDLPKALFASNDVDFFAFTSPSSVQALTSAIGGIKALSESVICAIGTTTRQACINAGLKVNIMPNEYTIEGLATEIKRFYSTNKDKYIHHN